MRTTNWPGAVVDCTIIVVALAAAHLGLIPSGMFIAIFFSMVGGRVVAGSNGGKPPSGTGGSVGVILLVGLASALLAKHGT